MSGKIKNSYLDWVYGELKFIEDGLKKLPGFEKSKSEKNLKNNLDKEFGKAMKAGKFILIDPESELIKDPKTDKIWVNDISLPWGGRFKIEGNMSSGHSAHKWGNCVDISYNSRRGINSKQKD